MLRDRLTGLAPLLLFAWIIVICATLSAFLPSLAEDPGTHQLRAALPAALALALGALAIRRFSWDATWAASRARRSAEGNPRMSTNETTAAIALTGVTRRFGEREILRGIDLEVRTGEVFGVIGPNGAGKTTALEIVAGLREPTSGTARVLGLDPARDRTELTRLLSVQPQAAALFPTLTVFETLELFAALWPDSRDPEETLARFGLEGSRRTGASKLSGGQLRRLLIALAVIGNPRIVVLDEPAAGLDPVARRDLWTLIRSLRGTGTTILLTTHLMTEAAELCDRIAVLVEGRILAVGSPSELVAAHGTVSVVRFRVPAGTDAAALRDVAGGDDLLQESEPGGIRVVIRTADPDAAIRRITFHRGLRASGIRVVEPSLEEVFLGLAGSSAASVERLPGNASGEAPAPAGESTRGATPTARDR